MILGEQLIILAGGDRREVELYLHWRAAGKPVKMFGFEGSREVDPADLAEADDFERAAVIIAPLSGIKADGTVNALYREKPQPLMQFIQRSTPCTLLLAGSIDQSLRNQLAGRPTCLTASDGELAVLNAVPTAEGAIAKAMELSDLTLHGNRSIVIGFGRCGTVLCRALLGLGASVSAVVRRRETAALALTMGLKVLFPDQLAAAARQADFVFNTAPGPVLNAPELESVQPDAVIIDLAAAPGGTDFEAAERLGLRAVLLPGLPGRVAPRSAGRILDRVYRRILAEQRKMNG